MKISVIIPTLNEEKNLPQLLERINIFEVECIVVDGGSTDNTLRVAAEMGVQLLSCAKGRAIQLNHGAMHATGEILYFVHADTLPPTTWWTDIETAIQEGFQFGLFSYRFSKEHWLLKMNAKTTKRKGVFTGGGDQTFFIQQSIFSDLGGFNPTCIIMEDFDMYWRASAKYKGKIIPNDVIVSARKYENNSWLKVQMVNAIAFFGYKLGFSQSLIKAFYQRSLRPPL